MKKSLFLLAAMAAASATPVNAATLFEWGININGSTTCDGVFGPPSCDSTILPAAVDTSLFDFTTGLGTISYTITGNGLHYTSLYVDHEVGLDPFNESGNEVGTLDPDQTWEIGDPFATPPGIFENFLASSLNNSNGVPAAPNDVAMALAWDFTLGVGIGAGETATVDFMVSLTAPTNGFFLLSLVDPVETIYFSSTLDIQPNPVPVPGALLLFGSGLVGLVGACFRRKSQKA